MNLKRQTSEGHRTGPTPMLTTSATGAHIDWLHEAAARFFTLQVPVGFEDEEGFHCGDPIVMETQQTATRAHESF